MKLLRKIKLHQVTYSEGRGEETLSKTTRMSAPLTGESSKKFVVL